MGAIIYFMFRVPLSNTSHFKGVFIGYCPVSSFTVANLESLSSRASFVSSLDSIDRKLISLFSCKQGRLQFRLFCLAQKRDDSNNTYLSYSTSQTIWSNYESGAIRESQFLMCNHGLSPGCSPGLGVLLHCVKAPKI